MLHYYRLIRYKTTFGSASIQLAAVMQICLQFYLRTTVLEKLVYILVTMNETSILHLAGGKVTLQARRAVNQSKKSPQMENLWYRDNLDFLIIFFLNLKFVINIDV
jgi:hypothetical protein